MTTAPLTYTVKTESLNEIRNGEPVKFWLAYGLYTNGHFANIESGGTEEEAIEKLHRKEASDEARRAAFRAANVAPKRRRK